MIQDASEHKMDLILCASVSRFARDVSDCIDQVRRLKTKNPSHPVGVYFETEDIYTLDPNVTERLEMHALFSEWESKNKSRRMILSYDQRICTGQYPVLDLLGYRHTYEGDLIIEPEEAKTVRFIYLSFIAGYSLREIADFLTEKQRPTLKGRTEWNSAMVKNIMQNERRWGDLSARKTICIDYKDKKCIKNNEERDSAYIPEHHDAIVTPAIAKAALALSPSKRYLSYVPEMYVIDKGNLKGFVSICPSWKGIDNDTLLSISKEVYDEDEYTEIVKISDIMSGKEESNVLSMTFAGYEVPYSAYFINNTTPSITLSYNRLKFSSACYSRLDDCDYVEVLYHPILQIIAIRATDEKGANAIRWKSSNGKPKSISSTDAFTKCIYDRTEWIHEYKFKMRGISRNRGNSKILLFYLDEPQILPEKRVRCSDDNSCSTAQYVPYKYENNSPDVVRVDNHAFPERFANANVFGLSLPLKKKRDSIIGNINEEDIKTTGKKIDNPLFGYIPSREEIWNELNQLIASM